jgi:hypothetical protein
MKYIFPLFFLVFILALSLFSKEVQSSTLPHHDFALVIPSSQDDYASTRTRLLDDIIEYLNSSHILPQGFPKACMTAASPSEDNPSINIISCIPGATENGKENGILLDADGHFIQFLILTCPDTQVYLFEIHLIERLPAKLLHTSLEKSVRIGVHLPRLEDTMYDTLLPALEEALIHAGAQKIYFEKPEKKQFTDK